MLWRPRVLQFLLTTIIAKICFLLSMSTEIILDFSFLILRLVNITHFIRYKSWPRSLGINWSPCMTPQLPYLPTKLFFMEWQCLANCLSLLEKSLHLQFSPLSSLGHGIPLRILWFFFNSGCVKDGFLTANYHNWHNQHHLSRCSDDITCLLPDRFPWNPLSHLLVPAHPISVTQIRP